MIHRVKTAGLRTKLKKHDIQDTRVTVSGTRSTRGKGSSDKAKSIKQCFEGFLIRQALFEIWSNRYTYWEDVCETAGSFWEWLIP
jgi:hypothetical protein